MPFPSMDGLVKLAWNHPQYVEHLVIKKLRLFSRYKWTEKNVTDDDKVPPPVVYKMVLTYKCNLRCSFCYQWGDTGWCKQETHDDIKKELPWEIVQKIFSQAGRNHPSFILIGGEPMLYSKFADLARTLKVHKCFAVTCTNGMLLDRFQDVSRNNPYLTYLISLDGLEKENDQLRGKGVYEKVTRNIRLMKALNRPPYIGIEFTIRPENVAIMYEFCQEMVKLNVDWVVLNLCWFVSKEQARDYEQFMLEHFNISPKSHLGYLMPYNLDKEEFVRQYRKILDEKWPIQISCYLKNPEDIFTFIDKPQASIGNTFCYKQWVRMDITPEGAVSPCILYPDLEFGDLGKQDVVEVWNSDEYANFRRLRRKGPLPICSKCDALYLYDIKRRIF